MGQSARFSAASYSDLCKGTLPIDTVQAGNGTLGAEPNLTSGGDDYPVETYDGFMVNQVLDAHWGFIDNEDSSKLWSHTLSLLIKHSSGILDITCIFARRRYDIQSLALGHSEKEGIFRFIIVVPGTDESIGKLVRQLYKLIDVYEVQDITNLPFAERDLMLIKVVANAAARREVLNIASVFQAKAVDVSDHTITLELTGDLDKMVAVHRLLEPYGICEVSITGRTWCTRLRVGCGFKISPCRYSLPS